ncbi:hypothetical protein LCGC14_2481480 [marine sediment metagenome]|uniref:Uncharacterized protein n=1 Tax=marine sediment metagenome TaxID=412755 RepID=A0A0F9E161_9ZZZZ
MPYPTSYVARRQVKNGDKPLNNPARCIGTGERGIIPEEYKHIKPIYRVKCGECRKEFKPNLTGLLPVHPPKGMNFTFPARYSDVCDYGRHRISKGDRVRYLGKKLVCAKCC